mmetsp:Transcript_32644/g.72103  ORF Transcript_32644/g.72103 Transcript_32644/m.72103 type:complete len:294 (+) Transcript_32644:119-1000(+)
MTSTEGAFYAYVSRPRTWFSFGRKQHGAESDLDTLVERYTQHYEEEHKSGPDFTKLSMSPREVQQSKVQKYIAGADSQCTLAVLPAVRDITAEIVRVLPYVHQSEGYLICFFGYLSNTAELMAHLHDWKGDELGDIGTNTTSIILHLYKRASGDNRALLMLSELQGEYAFFLYDGNTKQALAARDPTGAEELYYRVNPDDGSVAFTNSLDQLPDSEPASVWREVPPGHYVAGKTPALMQFALTPEQLQVRERHESFECGFELDSEEEEGEPEELPHSISGSIFARLSRKMSGT